jgi:hypothetical protein
LALGYETTPWLASVAFAARTCACAAGYCVSFARALAAYGDVIGEHGSSRQLAHVLAFGDVLCAAADSGFDVDLAGALTFPARGRAAAREIAADNFELTMVDKLR